MPARPNPGLQWAMFRLFISLDQKEASMEFWYSVTSGTISPSLNFVTITEAVYNALSAPLATVLSVTCTIRGAEGYFNNGTGTMGVEWYSSVSGGSIGDPLPGDVSVVVRKETAMFGGSGRGRWYVPQPVDTNVSGSYLSTSGVTNYTPVAVSFKTAVTSGGITLSPANFSRKLGILEPIVNTPLTALLGTTRRRRGPF